MKCETFWSLRCLIYCFVGPQVEMYLAPTSARTKNGKNCKLMLRENPYHKFGRGCSPSPITPMLLVILFVDNDGNLDWFMSDSIIGPGPGLGWGDHFIALLHLQSEAATKTRLNESLQVKDRKPNYFCIESIQIPRLRELATLANGGHEAGSRNLGIELFPNPVAVSSSILSPCSTTTVCLKLSQTVSCR